MNYNIPAYLALVAILTVPAYAFGEISLSVYDSTIEPKDRLLITGSIDGDIQEFKPVKLVVYDPSGEIVYEPRLKIDGQGEFKYMITPTIGGFESGTYTIEASHEDLKEIAVGQFTVNELFPEDIQTEVVPEFGTITMMILIVAITSIVMITAKTRGMSFNI